MPQHKPAHYDILLPADARALALKAAVAYGMEHHALVHRHDAHGYIVTCLIPEGMGGPEGSWTFVAHRVAGGGGKGGWAGVGVSAHAYGDLAAETLVWAFFRGTFDVPHARCESLEEASKPVT